MTTATKNTLGIGESTKDAYKFFTDPGHGWLEVTRNEINRLHVVPSKYSYMRGDLVYLEEDCDASAFIRAKKELGEKVETTEIYRVRTAIRNYPSFQQNRSEENHYD